MIIYFHVFFFDILENDKSGKMGLMGGYIWMLQFYAGRTCIFSKPTPININYETNVCVWIERVCVRVDRVTFSGILMASART